jgi:hypothetical protein
MAVDERARHELYLQLARVQRVDASTAPWARVLAVAASSYGRACSRQRGLSPSPPRRPRARGCPDAPTCGDRSSERPKRHAPCRTTRVVDAQHPRTPDASKGSSRRYSWADGSATPVRVGSVVDVPHRDQPPIVVDDV